MNIDPKLIHRLFYPQVPMILSTLHRGRVSAMPVVSYASVSVSPPLVAVACGKLSFTALLILKSKSFSLSVLDSSRLQAFEFLASKSGAQFKDKLSAAGLAHRKGVKLAVPVIDGAQATLECKLEKKISLGDHSVFVGSVKAARAVDSFSDSWDFSRYNPILYTGWKDGMTTLPGG